MVRTAPAGFPLRVRCDGPGSKWHVARVVYEADEVPDIAVLQAGTLPDESGLSEAAMGDDEHLHGQSELYPG